MFTKLWKEMKLYQLHFIGLNLSQIGVDLVLVSLLQSVSQRKENGLQLSSVQLVRDESVLRGSYIILYIHVHICDYVFIFSLTFKNLYCLSI